MDLLVWIFGRKLVDLLGFFGDLAHYQFLDGYIRNLAHSPNNPKAN
jgi:hypothetical protein